MIAPRRSPARRLVGLCLLGSALLWCGPWVTASRSAGDAAPVVLEQLRDSRRFPWYDAAAQEPRPVDLRARSAPPAPQEMAWLRNWLDQWNGRSRGNWSGFWRAVGEVLELLAWAVMLAFAVFLVYMMLRRNRKSWAGTAADTGESDGELADAGRLQQLPIALSAQRRDLLAEARACRQRGEFDQAIIYLFSYQLMKLDRNHWLHLEQGKTNRQYLRELAAQPQADGSLCRLLRESMVAFEDVFFGRHTLGAERFDHLWAQLDEFDTLVRPPHGAAS